MDTTKIIITTERLLLVPLSLEYAEDLFAEFTDEITEYMYPKTPINIQETIDYITQAIPKMQKGTDMTRVILNKDTKEFLGAGGLHQLDTDTPEPGIWIKKSAHGNGYGKEAIAALKDWAEKNLKYSYLKYPVDKRNIGSRKIAESLGGIIEDEYQKANMAGKMLDEVEYRIYKK